MTRRRLALAGLVTAAVLLAAAVKPAAGQTDRTRQTFFVGVDTSGSFQKAGYDDAMTFLAHYLYGHLNGLGGLARPRELFVAAIGGREGDEPKAFRPIHDFVGKDVAQLEADLRQWFPARDTLTDFNAFFRQVARLARERNLLLTPITVMVVSDGVPDVPASSTGHGSACQMSLAYSTMVRSLENVLHAAMLSTALPDHCSWFAYNSPSRVCASL